jgi:hypothetical protein
MTTLRRLLVAACLVSLIPSSASAARLSDGTPIRVRILGVITSETSFAGDPMEFVVVRDVVRDGEVVIARGARVSGAVVVARRMSVGWSTQPGRLAFRFHSTASRRGQAIRLRATPDSTPAGSVMVDRDRRHHWLQWAGGGDTFEAFVDGDYDL